MLRELAPCSLKERCARFQQRFPDRFIRPYVASAIMRKAGIRKKAVITRKQAVRHDARRAEFARATLSLS